MVVRNLALDWEAGACSFSFFARSPLDKGIVVEDVLLAVLLFGERKEGVLVAAFGQSSCSFGALWF